MTTSIEWTDATWNPVRGCSVLSAGCTNCYAMRQAHRFSAPGQPYEGLTRERKRLGPAWTGEVRFVPEKLAEPLRWRKPRRVFVNSMSDLFHEGVSNEQIAAIFGVMAAAPQHTFQVLTKRPERAREWFESLSSAAFDQVICVADDAIRPAYRSPAHLALAHAGRGGRPNAWPLPNVWLGVSVEGQATADERIPHLLDCPAAVRWVSYEPALGPIDDWRVWIDGAEASCAHRLDWIVIGGESGPGARPFDLAWARSTIAQCREAGVRAFFKQAGGRPVLNDEPLRLHDRKGGDLAELPADLHVREWPDAAH